MTSAEKNLPPPPAQQLCIGIVIPVRNRKHFTQAILAQLTQQIAAQAAAHRIQVIVIDDGSSDGTPELIAAAFPQVHLLSGDGELWWTGAIATGMAYAIQTLQVDYIAWLNDDIAIAADFATQLIDQCRRDCNRSVITGGIVCDRTHNNWVVFGGVIASRPINDIHQFADQANLAVDTLNGNIAVMPAKLVAEIGLPDVKRFRHYGGDYEYICRAKQAGYRIQLSRLLQATTDYQTEDVIRYMPLWIQWYTSINFREKWTVLKSLVNRKSPFNVEHMVNSIYRSRNQVPVWQYWHFYIKKMIKLIGSEFVPRSLRRRQAEMYFKHHNIPDKIVQTVLSKAT